MRCTHATVDREKQYLPKQRGHTPAIFLFKLSSLAVELKGYEAVQVKLQVITIKFNS